ncbi:MAG: hypothetical protein RL414_302 [Actinomycetota bacterium]|jgi:hypothetical protein
MALSDRERQLLAEMEAALEQDDPRLVSTLSGKVRTPQGSKVLAGVIALFAGMAILLTGLIAQIPAVGIAGFIVALLGSFLIISNFSAPKIPGNKGQHSGKKPWGDRLGDRWDNRNFGN